MTWSILRFDTKAKLVALGAYLLVSPTVTLAQMSTEPDALDVALSIEISPETGIFVADAWLEAPQGDVILPDAEWLTIDSLTVAGQAVPVETVSDGVVEADSHQQQDIRATMSVSFPPVDVPMVAAASRPEATYVIGAIWFPFERSAIRDHVLTISVPQDQRIAATGTLMEESSEDGKTRSRFAFRGHSTDLALFTGPYEVTERLHDDLRLRTYFEPEASELSPRYLSAVAEYIDRYEAEVGDYPYGGFSVVSSTMPVGLGFAGLTYVSRDILAHSYMTGRSLAHEVLHSWWGNAVGVDYATGNWAEGLTTFQADYALAEELGAQTARDVRINWIRNLASLPDHKMRPLTAFRSSSHAGDQSEGYGKAALVFHMLRAELGNDTFSLGIQRFYRANLHAIASWSDLQTAFEQTSGRELDWFFEQWVRRSGLPEIWIADADVRNSGDGSYEVTLDIEQSAPAYRLRIPIVLETASGEQIYTARIRETSSSVTFTLSEPPGSVRLDPDFNLVRRPLAGELAPILRSLNRTGQIIAVSPSHIEDSGRILSEILAPLTGDVELVWQDRLPEGDTSPTLIVGYAGDVAMLRPSHLGPMPEIAEQGATRFWIERDDTGRLWGFLMFDALEDLETDLSALRFYTSGSYVAFENGEAIQSGVWPVPADAAAILLDISSTE
ncbi:M1 family aminopeptidase [Gymnodinialimonas sp. 2305UL16-5]|uniref:M1 family metallopeptidase n=1 Tax=Gymnodinialimonas mytili TaxID=3126503 RepID=UPI0030A3E454